VVPAPGDFFKGEGAGNAISAETRVVSRFRNRKAVLFFPEKSAGNEKRRAFALD
jgi:hypothetical protein